MMRLEQTLFATTFQNPVLLAAGTCGFGQELADLIDIEGLGGFVTKSVTVDPRLGNPSPRVSELAVGMVNSIGLANPGVDRVRTEKLPWIRRNVKRARVFVSVAGHTIEEYGTVLGRLDGEDGFLGYELNLSCPNVGGIPFALDASSTSAVVSHCRTLTDRPLLAKLAPNTPDITVIALAAESAGADGITLVNTLPALVLDPRTARPILGAGAGGLSGPALRPVGVHATYRTREAVAIPVLGVGGIIEASDAVQYLMAGASLVQVGTASFADPRAGERLVGGLLRLGREAGIKSIDAWVGAAHRGTGSS